MSFLIRVGQMELHRDGLTDSYQIKSYAPELIRINNQSFTQSIIISKDTLEIWRPQTVGELETTDFKIIANLKPDVFILGTGSKQHFPDLGLLKDIINQNIGYEIMNSSAAARTFNVLISEGRKVIAAILIR